MNKLFSLRNQVRKILGNPGLDLKVRKKNPKEIKHLIFTKHNIHSLQKEFKILFLTDKGCDVKMLFLMTT